MAKTEATLLLTIKEIGSSAINKTKDALTSLKEVAVVAYGQMVAVGAWAIKSWRDQELATNKLNQALVTQGIYTKELSSEYAAMASSLQKTTLYADEVVMSAQAQIQAFLGMSKVTPELTRAILDFATAQGMDAVSAATALGKSIGTSTNALGRYGIAIDSSLTKQEKMAVVIEQVNAKWGGQAEAAAGGLGILTQLKNVIGDVGEEIGARLAPGLEVAAGQLKAFAENSQSAIGPINSIAEGIVTMVGWADSVATKFVEVFGIIIPGVFAAVGESAKKAISGDFRGAMESFKAVEEQTRLDVEASQASHLARMKAMEDARIIQKAAAIQKDAAMVAAANQNAATLSEENAAIQASKTALNNEQNELIQQEHLDTMAGMTASQQLDAVNKQLLHETSATQRLALEQQKRLINNKITNEEQKKAAEDLFQFEKARNEAKIADRSSTFSTIATLSKSNNKVLAGIGKAAAITEIAIQTPLAIGRALSAFPPPFNFVAAGLVGAAMAAQAANVAGVPLAEGGIVQASNGGTRAIIGEGGSDEAVIPLDSPQGQALFGGGGGSVTINFTGPVLGDPSQAREFAIQIDRELLRLRRDGESVAFDTRLA